jgi:hypothetical protein
MTDGYGVHLRGYTDDLDLRVEIREFSVVAYESREDLTLN